MNPIQFKPLPSFGGTIEDRITRTPAAQKALEDTRQWKSEEAEKQLQREREVQERGKLNQDQIKHWRFILSLNPQIGAAAYILPDNMIQEYRDILAKRLLTE